MKIFFSQDGQDRQDLRLNFQGYEETYDMERLLHPETVFGVLS